VYTQEIFKVFLKEVSQLSVYKISRKRFGFFKCGEYHVVAEVNCLLCFHLSMGIVDGGGE